jgi:hypothetical protein
VELNKKYKQRLRKIFSTPEGKEVLKEWKKVYVDGTSFSKTPETTYANLALKEFVLGLLSDIMDEDIEKHFTTHYEGEIE